MSVDAIRDDAMAIYDAGMDLMRFILGLVPEIAPLRPRFHKTKAQRKKRAKG
jgi:hypothetical protein